jgi:hypothetical protein
LNWLINIDDDCVVADTTVDKTAVVLNGVDVSYTSVDGAGVGIDTVDTVNIDVMVVLGLKWWNDIEVPFLLDLIARIRVLLLIVNTSLIVSVCVGSHLRRRGGVTVPNGNPSVLRQRSCRLYSRRRGLDCFPPSELEFVETSPPQTQSTCSHSPPG